QMSQLGGSFRITADSEAIADVLRLTGVAQTLRGSGPATGPAAVASKTLDLTSMTLQVFPAPPGAAAAVERVGLIGDPTKLASRGYGAADDRTWRAVPGAVALGLGALGREFDGCRDRYGEFLAAAGVAAYRPSGGLGQPD